jgi:hypothetical protein
MEQDHKDKSGSEILRLVEPKSVYRAMACGCQSLMMDDVEARAS